MTRIVGILRFSVLTEGSKSYKTIKDKTLAEAMAGLFDPDRLDRRCLLAKTMPLASLDAQTDMDFELVVRISALLPQAYKEQVYEMARARAYMRVVEFATDGSRTVEDTKPITAGPTITFRIDDDDALNRHYIEDLRVLAVPENLGKVISCPNGVYVQPHRRPDRMIVGDVLYKNNAFGLAFYGADGKTIFDKGGHSRIDRHPMIMLDRSRAWVRSIHQGSDSGAGLKVESQYERVLVRDMKTFLPEYAHLDFTDLMRGLWYDRTPQRDRDTPAAAPPMVDQGNHRSDPQAGTASRE
jgi:hypothetical protein